MTIQPHLLITMGVLLLSLATVESGGYFLTRVVRGHVAANDLQRGFFRAGHAHAAVLLVLSFALIASIGYAALDGVWLAVATYLVPVSALLMPAGFFLSVIGKDPQKPNRLIALLWIGAACLTVGLIVAGVGLIAGGAQAV